MFMLRGWMDKWKSFFFFIPGVHEVFQMSDKLIDQSGERCPIAPVKSCVDIH